MRIITRTTNPNGTYRYEIDGEVIYKASKVLYTHASSYTVGDSNPGSPVLFHKTEAAAGRARGYQGWVKTGTQAIEDGDTTPAAPTAPRPAHIPADQWDAMTADEQASMGAWEAKMGRTAPAVEAAPSDAPQAPSCTHCAAHPGWAHGETTRRVEARDVCGVCLGTGTPVPPAKRRAPRNGTRVRVNAQYPGQAYKGSTGKVHSKRTGDDGARYVMVDFRGVTWPFQIHELDVI